MQGHTQWVKGLDGARRRDLTFLRGCERPRAKQIHFRLQAMRAAGVAINNWWYYENDGRFVIEWSKPLFSSRG